MQSSDILIMVALTALSALSQFFFKKAAATVTTSEGAWLFIRSIINIHAIVGGLILVFVPLAYIHVLQRASLSSAYAFTALNYLFVIFGARVFLKEHLTPRRWMGVGLIIVGVVLSAY